MTLSSRCLQLRDTQQTMTMQCHRTRGLTGCVQGRGSSDSGSEAAKQLLREYCSELTDKNCKEFLRRIKERCGWLEMRRGCRKGFATQLRRLQRLRSVTNLGILWQVQLSSAMWLAAGSSWPEGGAKGKACTLKLNTRSPKLFKLLEWLHFVR